MASSPHFYLHFNAPPPQGLPWGRWSGRPPRPSPRGPLQHSSSSPPVFPLPFPARPCSISEADLGIVAESPGHTPCPEPIMRAAPGTYLIIRRRTRSQVPAWQSPDSRGSLGHTSLGPCIPASTGLLREERPAQGKCCHGDAEPLPSPPLFPPCPHFSHPGLEAPTASPSSRLSCARPPVRGHLPWPARYRERTARARLHPGSRPPRERPRGGTAVTQQLGRAQRAQPRHGPFKEAPLEDPTTDPYRQ